MTVFKQHFQVMIVTLFALNVHAQVVEFEGQSQPADVLLAVNEIANEVETIRQLMGKQLVTQDRFRVEFATPRHVFYQTQTMFRKINRLGTEVAGITRQSPPPAPELDSTILPQDVLRMVNLGQNQLDIISDTLGIVHESKQLKREPRAESKGVFEAVVQINRQVNLMIDQPFRPSDVYGQLVIVSSYLGRILSVLGEEPFPILAEVQKKQPVDVYDRIIDCLVLNQRIGEKLNIPVLRINPRQLKRVNSVLSDNYDLATMLVSDVAFWTEAMKMDDDVFPPDETLRNIFPSHVYAKASLIWEQLDSILDHL